MSNLGPLQDGARVAVIGGGASGVGCALALRHLAERQGRQLEISVVESKVYAGERHHNLCVGVLAAPLPVLMQDCLGVPFPEHLNRGSVSGYVLHTEREQICLEDVERSSVIMRRVLFDNYMLESARSRGIKISQARAVAVNFHDDRVVVYTDSQPIEADVVVGAFGMDEGSVSAFAYATDYRPPKAMISMLFKYDPTPAEMAKFDAHIHAFLPRPFEIEFGAITPKGSYVTINIAGTSVDAGSLKRFLAYPEVLAALPSLSSPAFKFDRLLIFRGRFPRTLARHYYGDRYVMVGDAAGLMRAFKGKGVTSGIQTGIRAAETMLNVGISHAAFADYYEKANRDITDDALYGRGMRLLVEISARFGLIDPVIRAARRDPHVRHALFGAVSAHDSYRHILGDILDRRAVLSVLQAMLPGGMNS